MDVSKQLCIEQVKESQKQKYFFNGIISAKRDPFKKKIPVHEIEMSLIIKNSEPCNSMTDTLIINA